ncbi:MAG: TetR/AcrR family transcriptional regulator C-terminal domain-containing protein [Solirubrobacteraceae bacterium]
MSARSPMQRSSEASPGGGSPERRRGRPPRIDREAVLDAATRLLDGEGVEALTMRRLASELGVSVMAPYRYVGSKDELLMVLLDRLAARLVYPPRPPDPKGAMLVLWSTIYNSLAEHPWVPEVLARRRMMASSVLGAIEEIHAALRAAGLSIQEAVRAYRLMWNFTLGSLLVRAGVSSESPSEQRALRSAPDPERYPMLAAAAAAWSAAHDRDTYRDDLDALIDALLASARP